MARPKQEVIREIDLKIRLSETEYEELERLAEHMELPISTCVRNLVLYAKEDAEFYKKIGFFKGIKKVSEWFNLDIKPNKDERTIQTNKLPHC